LQALNDYTDIVDTFANFSKAGINLVRTWAFNGTSLLSPLSYVVITESIVIDVTEIPPNNETWFQALVNGTLVFNEGPNGLPKLDQIVTAAENAGVFLQLALTNNWNPKLDDTSISTGIARRNNTPAVVPLPRNYLCNDYGRDT
jgi:mannan endo-1,4-beta-mannosidase